jgi:predicted HicB family RNase H-like nuclease
VLATPHHRPLFACWQPSCAAGKKPKQRIHPRLDRYPAHTCAYEGSPMADRKQLNVPVDPELAEAVRRAAHRAYRSKASWIRDVLRRAAAS